MAGTRFVRRMALLGSALLLITTLQLLPERDFERASNAEHQVEHTLRVLRTSALLQASVEDAEAGERGYLLTGEDRYLQPFAAALSSQGSARQDLLRLTADNQEQQARIAKLDRLLQTKSSELNGTVALYKTAGPGAALASFGSEESRRATEEIRDLLSDAEQEEYTLLQRRTKGAEAQANHTRWILSALLFLLLAAGGAAGERDIRIHERDAEALKRSDTVRKVAEQEVLRINAELERRVRQRTLQLESANHELESFAYSVSHDLRAPLRGIDGWSLALLEDCAAQLDESGRQYLNRVRSETQSMGRLIDDMLQLSRVSRGEIKVIPVDLTALAKRIAAGLRDGQPERSLEFRIEPKLAASGDSRLIEIALTNLFSNAVKFTGKRDKAVIEFGSVRQDGERAYYVRDNGAGFDMAYAGNLFGAFQRLHKLSEFPGSGIGLATVQRVVHRHGGRVWAEAQVNRGATFSFTLGATS